MFPNDHLPPHFHVKYSGWEATILINSFDILEGELPITALRLVRKWSRDHQLELLDCWNQIQARLPFKKIKPLD